MKVHHTLICFFFLSALQDGHPEVTSAEFLYYGVPGEDVTVRHAFQSSGTWKMFCREKCEGENILINTTDVRAQRGRYRIEYRYESTYYVFSVSISKLTTSDSGQYRCGLGGSSSAASFVQFRFVVAEGVTPSTPSSTRQKQRVLYMGLTLPAAIILFLVAVLIFCKKTSSKPNDSPVETEYAATTKPEDDSSKLTCAVLNLSSRTFGGPSSNTCSVSQIPHYKNCTPVSAPEDSTRTYQSLNAASRDLDQIYSTFTHHK